MTLVSSGRHTSIYNWYWLDRGLLVSLFGSWRDRTGPLRSVQPRLEAAPGGDRCFDLGQLWV